MLRARRLRGQRQGRAASIPARGKALKRCHFSRVNPVIFACSEVDQPEHWHLLIEGA
jgi:hypothetical protein